MTPPVCELSVMQDGGSRVFALKPINKDSYSSDQAHFK